MLAAADVWPMLQGRYHQVVVPANATPVVPAAAILNLKDGLVKANQPPKALLCMAAGNISITDPAGTTVVYTVVAGQLLQFMGAVSVNATSTTVANNSIVAWW